MSFHISSHSVVPPGFRFHPTDEELVGYYLQKKVVFKKIDLDVIRDIDLYKLEPWDIQEKCRIGSGEQNEWYFFSHKDKKYPTGTRTNRATTAGFWKATGRDKAIFTKFKLIGMRKTLVFYKGRAPNGQKTDWIMHEYRLEDDINNTTTNEEGWVICRVFKKRSMVKRPSEYGGHGGYNSLIPDLESLDKYINSNIYCNPTFNCKQEVDMNYYNPCQGSFLLPQLESPKSASDPSNALALLFEENNNALSYPSFVKMDNSALQDQPSVQQNQFHEINEGLGTEWSAIDRVVSELNQHEDQNETRFTTGNDSLEDTPVASRFIKGHLPVDYPYCSDIDLWTYAQP